LTVSRKTNNTCDSTAGDLTGYMNDATAAQTHVCYDGFTFYVINPTLSMSPRMGFGITQRAQLSALPGGTWNNMQDPRWAGLSLDDFVISSWEGYKKNGMQNGYSPETDEPDSDTGIVFGDGVRTPGFASLPLCDDMDRVFTNVRKNDRKSPFYPCN